jgi:hypothetical protein
MRDYLQQLREPVPDWLANFDSPAQFDSADFMASRIVFYPGSGFDGHAVELFGSTHSAHCFVYADYGVAQSALEEELINPKKAFRGYSSMTRVHLTGKELSPSDWIQHVRSDEVGRYRFAQAAKDTPYRFVEILERQPEFDDTHGAARLAILFLGADGIATCDAIFCQHHSPPLFAALIQDHGFGGGYTKFGRGGLMEKIVARTGRFPQLIVCPPGMEWESYTEIPGLQPDRGGMHHHARRLYQRQ